MRYFMPLKYRRKGLKNKKLTYASSGVDIEEGDRFVQAIKPIVKKTFRPEVLTGLGGFGGLFEIPAGKYKQPVLVSSTDGVGTKLKIAFMTGIHDTVGIDLVAMCVNDILVQGAEPLFFLDYFGTSALKTENAAKVVEGIAAGCIDAGCALIGGETAEMPGFYDGDDYDLAGFSVGVVEKEKIIDGSAIKPGDVIIGLASSGLHSNGYSLARKVVFDIMGLGVDSPLTSDGKTVGEVLLTPTKIYVKAVLPLLADFDIKGMAHITGGGLVENLPRVLPEGVRVAIDNGSWDVPEVFDIIQKNGDIEEKEMNRVFNNGIGFTLFVSPNDAEGVLKKLADMGEVASAIGEVISGDGDRVLIR